MHASLQKGTILLETRIKNKKIYWVLEFDQSKRLKACTEFNTQKIIEPEENYGKCFLQINGKCSIW